MRYRRLAAYLELATASPSTGGQSGEGRTIAWIDAKVADYRAARNADSIVVVRG